MDERVISEQEERQIRKRATEISIALWAVEGWDSRVEKESRRLDQDGKDLHRRYLERKWAALKELQKLLNMKEYSDTKEAAQAHFDGLAAPIIRELSALMQEPEVSDAARDKAQDAIARVQAAVSHAVDATLTVE